MSYYQQGAIKILVLFFIKKNNYFFTNVLVHTGKTLTIKQDRKTEKINYMLQNQVKLGQNSVNADRLAIWKGPRFKSQLRQNSWTYPLTIIMSTNRVCAALKLGSH